MLLRKTLTWYNKCTISLASPQKPAATFSINCKSNGIILTATSNIHAISIKFLFFVRYSYMLNRSLDEHIMWFANKL